MMFLKEQHTLLKAQTAIKPAVPGAVPPKVKAPAPKAKQVLAPKLEVSALSGEVFPKE